MAINDFLYSSLEYEVWEVWEGWQQCDHEMTMANDKVNATTYGRHDPETIQRVQDETSGKASEQVAKDELKAGRAAAAVCPTHHS